MPKGLVVIDRLVRCTVSPSGKNINTILWIISRVKCSPISVRLRINSLLRSQISTKLNPEKCVFGVPRGMLLGYIVSQSGIEANLEKVSAITRMGPIRDVKGVQKVTGCLVALSRFISRLGEKALPLYRLLKKAERFSWTLEAEEALDNLKKTLTSAPVLVPPQPTDPLLLYVALTTQVVSAAVVVERQEGHALPV